jgi:HD-GYP domain-containing protein (c-di-GMP phosphodiesterase class II)
MQQLLDRKKSAIMKEINKAEIPLYSNRVIENYLKLIKQKYPHINISEILSHANMRSYEVADQGHWFTQTQIDRFYEKLVEVTGNKNIAREAGRYAASPNGLGFIRQYALALVGPSNAFKLIDQASSTLTKSAHYHSQELGPNKFRITVTPREGVHEKPFQCENRLGFWEAIVMLLGSTVPKIEHPECLFRGGDKCTYIISWEKTLSFSIKTLRKYLSAAMMTSLVFFFFHDPGLAFKVLTPSFLLFFLVLSFSIERVEKNEIIKNVSEVKGSTDQLLEQINRNYNNALMANEIGQAISSQTTLKNLEGHIDSNIDLILKRIVQILQKRLDFDRGLILLANQDKTRLIFRAGYGYSKQQQELLKNTAFQLDTPKSKGMFVVSFRKQEPFLVNDLGEAEASLSPRSLAFAKALDAKSFICCPIICDGESLGILAVDNIQSKRPLVNSDLTLLMGIAPVIGVSIRNADLLNAKRQQFNSILQVLSKTTDARDPLTAGHSEKVTEYALGICNELAQPQDFCEMIRVAALLHDYGKIAVPDAILKKSGRLTRDEYQIVKTHAQKTREILEQINFEGIYKCVPEIAGAHHEKLDGSGYPHGLQGDQIPLGAKIIAVADFFEAITSKRHYRDPMPLSVAFEWLREERGRHFEPTIVEALIRYFEKNHADEFKQKWKNVEIPERKSLRVPMDAPVSFTIEGKTNRGTIADISALGLYIASEQQETIDEGCQINLSFALPTNPDAVVETYGRVAWINNGNVPRKHSLPPGFGVEFIGLKKIATDAVFSYVLAQQLAI